MNYAFLPDLSALAILIFILVLVRRRHSEARADAWLLGLFFTLIEAIAHTFYAPQGMPNRMLHTIVVDCYLVAGLVFIWASGDQAITRNSRLLYLSANGLSLFALTTIYGLNFRVANMYYPAVAFGLAVGVTSSLYLRRKWSFALLYAAGWISIALLVSRGEFRQAIYWSLGWVYAVAALNFYRHLERHSTGKLAIVTGFAIWALCFFLHPWIVNYASYSDTASHVWTMQQSLISIGMILVMLEGQVANNEWLALHDELTGLPNRRLFASRLNRAIEHCNRRKTSLALVVLDLNGFKKINDSLGHLAGDHVLREIADTLCKSVRSSDTVARLGGDEFVIIAADMAETSVERFANSVRTAIEHPILLNGQPLRIHASIGAAIYPADAHDATKLVRLADQRMYYHKNISTQSAQVESKLGAFSASA